MTSSFSTSRIERDVRQTPRWLLLAGTTLAITSMAIQAVLIALLLHSASLPDRPLKMVLSGAGGVIAAIIIVFWIRLAYQRQKLLRQTKLLNQQNAQLQTDLSDSSIGALQPSPASAIEASSTSVIDAALEVGTKVPAIRTDNAALVSPAAGDAYFNVRPFIKVDQALCFLAPKQGKSLIECQDRFAFNPAFRRYAIADGVSRDYLSGPWAAIVSQSFVDHAQDFATQQDFAHWLSNCCTRWHGWFTQQWIPKEDEFRQRTGKIPIDWRAYDTPQTTLIGCEVVSNNQEKNQVIIRVFSLGDAAFFLFRLDERGKWKYLDRLPMLEPDDFGPYIDTISASLSAEMMSSAWEYKEIYQFSAQCGDLIVLASDALAKWFLIQIKKEDARLQDVLIIKEKNEFEQFVQNERDSRELGNDDTTMLLINV